MRMHSICLSALIAFVGCSAEDKKLPETDGGSPKTGDMRDDNALKLPLIWCPPGSFTMGSPPSEAGREDDENQVQVTLTSGFWLGQTEVTQEQWRKVMGTEPWQEHGNHDCFRVGNDYPAVYINWDDATEFCTKLTERERQTGRLSATEKYTLPTEAQWEYACRAGTSARFSFGDDESKLGEFAWFYENADSAGGYAHQVRLKKANPWGLHDMHGNVWEWCLDLCGDKLSGGRDPAGPTQGSDRLGRGGGWNDMPHYCRSASRERGRPLSRCGYLGFRVARSSVE